MLHEGMHSNTMAAYVMAQDQEEEHHNTAHGLMLDKEEEVKSILRECQDLRRGFCHLCCRLKRR